MSRAMRLLAVASSLVAAVALAQSSPPPQQSREELLRKARAISDLMKEGEPKTATKQPTLTPPEQLFGNKGKAVLLYGLPRNKPPAYQEYLRFVMDEGLFNEAVETVNGLVALPRNLPVLFSDCGQPNAFYRRDNGSITFCFEMVQLLDRIYSNSVQDPQRAKELIRGAVFFLFFHELGHALAHELDLPLTGKEEDAVDQFATLLLLEQGERGEQAVLAGATFFLAYGENPGRDLLFWDEHSLDKQRFYNISCWLYGASPFHQVNLVAQGLLPARRAARCGDEFQQLRRSWKTLADPKLKRALK